MAKYIKALTIGIMFLAIAGCLEEEEKDSAESIPAIAGACTSAISAKCDTVSNGTPAFVDWASGADCNSITPEIFVQGTAACDASGCAASATSGYVVETTDLPATERPAAATLAVIWFDVSTDGAAGDPDSNDVVCCKEVVSGNALLADVDCVKLP